MKYYAVKKGRKKGIFTSWQECEKYVKGVSGAQYKSFKSKKEAEVYLNIHSLNTLSKSSIIAYVDGSNIETDYGSGVVLLKDGEVIREISERGFDEKYACMWNVGGEICAAMIAVKEAIKLKADRIDIYYDYEGIEKWVTGEWKAKKEGTKSYRNTMKQLEKQIDIVFHKVVAHTGVKYNELADKLAKKSVGME